MFLLLQACLLTLLLSSTNAALGNNDPPTLENLAEQISQLIQINAASADRIAKLEEALAVKEAVDDAELDARVAHLEDLTRTKLFRSCNEMALHGITKSAIYEIDPDGEAKGESPIEVFCNFEYGFTEILHSFDNVTWTIPHCEEEFCSEWNMTYAAPMNQMKALIELSDTCSQEIIFDCFLAPLVYNNVDIAAWTDRWGEKQVYFDGANYGDHMCACDTDGNCYGSETFANKCNCDNTFEHEWKQDKGQITNKTALPIMAFNYGFLIYDVMEAMVHIGRLKCSGEAAYSTAPQSCRDLKMRGEQKSGLYLIEDAENNNFSMVSKCDMDGPDYNEVGEEKLGWQHFSTGPSRVSFVVWNSAIYDGPQNDTIQFDEIGVNLGKGFETDTFTAPVNGVYEFSFSALSTGEDGHHFTIDIMVDGNLYQQMTADNYQFTYLSKSWTIPLMLGNKVSLVLQDGAFYGEDKRAEFSGKLL